MSDTNLVTLDLQMKQEVSQLKTLSYITCHNYTLLSAYAHKRQLSMQSWMQAIPVSEYHIIWVIQNSQNTYKK